MPVGTSNERADILQTSSDRLRYEQYQLPNRDMSRSPKKVKPKCFEGLTTTQEPKKEQSTEKILVRLCEMSQFSLWNRTSGGSDEAFPTNSFCQINNLWKFISRGLSIGMIYKGVSSLDTERHGEKRCIAVRREIACLLHTMMLMDTEGLLQHERFEVPSSIIAPS